MQGEPPVKVCPVCSRRVDGTFRGLIAGHLDKTGRSPCPASYELSYETALAATHPVRSPS